MYLLRFIEQTKKKAIWQRFVLNLFFNIFFVKLLKLNIFIVIISILSYYNLIKITYLYIK